MLLDQRVIIMIRENDPNDNRDKNEKEEIAGDMVEFDQNCKKLADKLGLDPYDVKFWVLNYKEVISVSSRQGFPNRYPHWRWGMKFDRMRKTRKLSSEIHELVINSNPSHAFLQKQNSEAVQKAVIAHVYGHSDFFANNSYYTNLTDADNALDMFDNNANKVKDIMDRKDIDKNEVEKWIDTVRSLEKNIDHHGTYDILKKYSSKETSEIDIKEELVNSGISEDIASFVSEDEVVEKEPSDKLQKDILLLFLQNGKRYDSKLEKAVEMEDWRKEIIDIIRKESYYFAPQQMTKVMNEGWASYIESIMMSGENMVGSDNIIEYSKHFSRILGSQGFNPYKLGFQLWNYIEMRENRDQLIELLLQVSGINTDNFFEVVDISKVLREIKPDEDLINVSEFSKKEVQERIDDDKLDNDIPDNFDYAWEVLNFKGLSERHFNLNKDFANSISYKKLNEYIIYESEEFNTVEEALENFDYKRSWNKLRNERVIHNDVSFIEKYFDQEFADYYNYDTKEDDAGFEQMKNSLLFKFSNFGKPTILARDSNYNNSGELLLVHKYEGIGLDINKAQKTLERAFKLWGRPVHLKTVGEKKDEKVIIKLSYDGQTHLKEEMDSR